MSWQAGAFAILAIVLLGGFAWYERSKPPSQIVALVAVLAALAVAGRVAFPVIPNVVATTDVVFFCGYAVGAAPGFAVGALAGLVSNFWLGQGPWTPWQMAGWGMCGLIGASLATLSGRRLGRFSLAAACGMAGLAYGALLDFSLMVSYGGEQSWAVFLAYSARGIPFNIAHASGNIVIALVAGPAMIRMLVRFRQRFEVRWRPQPALLIAALAMLVVGAASSEPARGSGGGSTVAWMRAAQNSDGGFGTSIGASSNPGMTGWAALGLEGAGVNPLDFAKSGRNPVSYLRASSAQVRTLGDIERTVLVLRGAGLGARAFGGRDLVAELRRRRGADGSFEGQVNLTAFGIFALDAARARGGNARSAAWLRGAQNPDGGWGLAPHVASDADSTGAALQALAAAGGGSALAKGVAYLRGAQHPGGGFSLAYGGPVNAQSTAWAVQGLVAAGLNPASLRRGGSPLDYLAARRVADGHYRYSASSDQTPVWVTGQVLDAVSRAPFPISAVARSSSAAPGGGSSHSAAGSGSVPVPTPGAAGHGKKAKSPKKSAPGSTGYAPLSPTASTQPASSHDPAANAETTHERPSTLVIVLWGLAIVAALAALGRFLYRRRSS